MRAPFLAAAAIAMLLASGCVAAPGSSNAAGGKAKRLGESIADRVPIGDGWADAIFQRAGEGHDHYNMSQHVGLTTPNFKVVGWTPLLTDYYGQAPAGGYFCSDTSTLNGRTLSVVHSWVSDVALVISDVTDPSHPQKIGELALANTHVYDLSITPDQKSVLLATSPISDGINNGIQPPPFYAPSDVTFRDACTGEVRSVLGPEQALPFASGIILVDISNPRNPQVSDFRFFPPSGGHSVQVQEVDGKQLILVSQSGAPGYYFFMDFIETAAGRKMELLAPYVYTGPQTGSPAPVGPPPLSLHDGFIQKHPITHDTLAYLAYGGNSLVIVNINNPRLPTLVSRWADWGKFGDGAPANPFVHEALPIEGLWDGRHYTFIGEECGGSRPKTPTCLAAIIDTTDPAKPTFVGGWTLPIDVHWQGNYLYSLHYIALANRTLYISLYHGGLWAVDVSTPEAMRTMPSVGVFSPEHENSKPVAVKQQYDMTPVVLDANPLPDGKLVVYDGTTGLYVVTFDANNPAPAPKPWPFPFNQ